jgi:rubrerythrin
MNQCLILPPSRHSDKTVSRRSMVIGGAIAGISSALGFHALTADKGIAMPSNNDGKILNNALYYEHQAIWAYNVAVSKLSDTDVGKAVKALALKNQADHMAHRDALATVVRRLGVTPVMAENSYDLSSYIQKGEGNLDSDVNIAKLALALETDAAIAYTTEIAQLKNPALITAGASIGSNESAHAAAIRAAFISLGVGIDYVPASFVSADTRPQWVLKV